MDAPLLEEHTQNTKTSCWIFLKKIWYGRHYQKEESVSEQVLTRLRIVTQKINEIKKLKLRLEHEINDIEQTCIKLQKQHKSNELEQQLIIKEEKESFLNTLNAIITKFEILRSELKKAQVLTSCYNSLKDLNETLSISMNDTLDIDKVDRLMATIDVNMESTKQINKAITKPFKTKNNNNNNNNTIVDDIELPDVPKTKTITTAQEERKSIKEYN